jgi:hypothetical protein
MRAMEPAARYIRYARYVAFVWIPLAGIAALLIEHPGWTIAIAGSGVVVPLLLVVVATLLDPRGPHRPDGDVARRIRRSQARSA